jgi:Protein of unknown function (DUF2845)
MPASRFRAAIAFSVLALIATPAYAFRCGTRLISPGDNADKVLHFCGEPISVQTRLAERSYVDELGRTYFFPGLRQEVVIEEWTYNFGPHQFMRLVRLENGFVAEIKQLGYGY